MENKLDFLKRHQTEADDDDDDDAVDADDDDDDVGRCQKQKLEYFCFWQGKKF